MSQDHQSLAGVATHFGNDHVDDGNEGSEKPNELQWVTEVTETTPACTEQQREADGTECHLSGTGVTLQYRKMEGGSETKIHLFPKTM